MSRRPCVAVIGAGPAGCAASIALGQRDISTVMVERGRPGKDKACGDAFMAEAVKSLTVLGITRPALKRLGKEVSAVSLFANGMRLWNWRLGEETGFVVVRSVIDQALRDVASRSAEILYETRVRDIVAKGRNRWDVETQSPAGRQTIRVDGVILATGSADGLARRLGIDGHPIRFWSVTGYRSGQQSSSLAFDFLHDLRPGYGWCFPAGGTRVNIGICAFSPVKGQVLRAAFDAYDQSLNPDTTADRPSLRGGVGNGWSGKGRQWHLAGGVLTCGDAAGLIDPLTGEGLGPALQSGLSAGAAMADHCLHHHGAPLAAYSAWVHRYFSDRHAGTPLRRNWAELCGFRPLMPSETRDSANDRQ